MQWSTVGWGEVKYRQWQRILYGVKEGESHVQASVGMQTLVVTDSNNTKPEILCALKSEGYRS